MRDLSPNGCHPAKGLTRLTWPQIEKIDAMVSSLCAFTEGQPCQEAMLILVIKSGKLRFGATTELTQVMAPNRP